MGLLAAAASAAAGGGVSIKVGEFPPGETPSFIVGDEIEVVAVNEGAASITGVVSFAVNRWDGVEMRSADCSGGSVWQCGETRRSVISSKGLSPDGYELEVRVGGRPVAEAIRFGLFAPYKTRELFGIGNGMICEWHPGRRFYGVTNAVEARCLKPVAMGKGDAFEAAIVRAPQAVECGVDGPSKRDEPEINVPSGRHLNCYSPAGRAELRRRARAFGEKAARNPQWAITKLRNEEFYLNKGDFCPDKWADADFRKWLKRRYDGDLARLNAAWGADLLSWDDVVQPISVVGGSGQVAKEGSEAVDWMAAMGKFTDDSKSAIRRNPAQSMDWFRWRSLSVNRVFAEFVAEAKKAAPGANVLYGNNYPWPNFFAHIIWPQWRRHDVIELDLQYVCGFPKTLGSSNEMIDILEAAESVGRGKPIWGREVYYQPRYPGEVAALQNWAMVAHGMDVALVFAWKPYADSKREIFKTGPRCWELPGAQPMWFMIDTDGTRLPGYHAAKRSAAEIAAFHEKIDARLLERVRGDTALFWAADTSVYMMYDTFDRPYQNAISTVRSVTTASLRYSGARVEFFDDATLGEVEPELYPVCVVPPSPVVSSRSLAALREYAERGGRLVLLSPFNTLDVNLRPKSPEDTGTTGWKGDVRIVECGSGRPAGWIDEFMAGAGIKRHAWWENESSAPSAGGRPGEGAPLVEVVVRRHAKTGKRYAFVLNKGGAGRGRLCGPDFDGVRLVDAITGGECDFAMELPAFGYRIFELARRN